MYISLNFFNLRNATSFTIRQNTNLYDSVGFINCAISYLYNTKIRTLALMEIILLTLERRTRHMCRVT